MPKEKQPARPKTPMALDRFLPREFRALQHVMEHGQITIKFQTKSQATNNKFRMIRLMLSLQAYAPHDPVSKASKHFFTKCRGLLLTIGDWNRSQEEDAFKAAFDGKVEDISADPSEMLPIDWTGVDWDAHDQEQRERQEQDINALGGQTDD